MLRDAKAVEGCLIHATDGDIGRVHDLFFDDASWAVRYFVVNTGAWLNLRRVLLSPASIREADWRSGRLHVNLTRRQVRDSPDVSSDMPVSRQQEEWLRSYYAWPAYWEGGAGLGIAMAAPVIPMTPPEPVATPDPVSGDPAEGSATSDPRHQVPRGDPHLRSVRDLRGYHLGASDGGIGHIEDVVVDDGHWAVDHILGNTRHWIAGTRVVVFPDQIEGVDWINRRVGIRLTTEQLRNAPEAGGFRAA